MYRARTGRIYGWTEAPSTQDWEKDGERVIDTMPVVIFVEFANASFTAAYFDNNGRYSLNKNFFSHRRTTQNRKSDDLKSETGRQASVIGLR